MRQPPAKTRVATVLFALSVSAICTVAEPASAAETPLRVAVIDAGGKPAVPPELLDLLVARLSQQADLVLLERQEIDSILHEHGRTLSLTDNAKRDSFVAAGRLFGADALVLVSALPATEQKLLPVEARIVETRRGVRFGESVWAWSDNEQSMSQQLESVTEQIANRLACVRNSHGEFILVSFNGFRSDEFSQEAHKIRQRLELWLASWLASQHGIAVAERTEVLPLIEERKLSSDLPLALGNADATLDGTFKLDFSNEQPRVELTLRMSQKDRSADVRSLSAPVGDLATLRESAGKAVLDMLEHQSQATPFYAKAEARMLTDEAQRLLTLRRRVAALNRLVTAYALDPDSLDTRLLLLRAGPVLGAQVDLSGALFEGQFYPTALLLCDVAQQAIDNMQQGVLPSVERDSDLRDEILGQVGEICKLVHQAQLILRRPTESDLAYHEWLRAATGQLFQRYLAQAQTENQRSYETALYIGLHWGVHWAESPRMALEQRYQLYLLAAQLLDGHRLGPFGNWNFVADHRFRLTDNKAWTPREDLKTSYEAYFQEMQASTHSVVRAVGEREAANYCLWVLQNRERALEHYRLFIDLIEKEIIPKLPHLADEVHDLWLELNSRSGALALTDAEAGNLWSRVILARWSTERSCPKSSQPWEHRIKKTMLHLEKAGLVKEANHLLQSCIAALLESLKGSEPYELSSQWQETLVRLQELKQGLVERHPELGSPGKQIPSLTVQCQSLFQSEQVSGQLQAERLPIRPDSWQFLTLAAATNGYVALCTALEPNQAGQTNRFSRQEWVAILRLDKRGNLQSTTLFPQPLTYDYRRSRIDNGALGQRRPFLAVGNDIFLAVPSNGIIWFPLNDAPVHFSSQYLENSDHSHRPLPFEEARQLIPMDRQLYILADDFIYPMLYELDYQRSKVSRLLDISSLPEDNPLHRRRGFTITAGPPGHLLVKSHPGDGPRRGKDLITVNLEDRSAKYATAEYHLEPPPGSKSQRHLCIRTEKGELAVLDSRKLSLHWLLFDRTAPLSSNSLVTSTGWHDFVFNQHSVLTSIKNAWVLYEIGQLSPRQLTADNLPAPTNVLSYQLDAQNQVLMLTSKELFRVVVPAP